MSEFLVIKNFWRRKELFLWELYLTIFTTLETEFSNIWLQIIKINTFILKRYFPKAKIIEEKHCFTFAESFKFLSQVEESWILYLLLHSIFGTCCFTWWKWRNSSLTRYICWKGEEYFNTPFIQLGIVFDTHWILTNDIGFKNIFNVQRETLSVKFSCSYV